MTVDDLIVELLKVSAAGFGGRQPIWCATGSDVTYAVTTVIAEPEEPFVELSDKILSERSMSNRFEVTDSVRALSEHDTEADAQDAATAVYESRSQFYEGLCTEISIIDRERDVVRSHDDNRWE